MSFTAVSPLSCHGCWGKAHLSLTGRMNWRSYALPLWKDSPHCLGSKIASLTSPLSFEGNGVFRVTGLREEVEGLGLKESVAACHEEFEVAGLSRGIAGSVNDAGGPKVQSLLEKDFVAAFSRGVHDKGASLSDSFQFLKNGRRLTEVEFGVGNLVQEPHSLGPTRNLRD